MLNICMQIAQLNPFLQLIYINKNVKFYLQLTNNFIHYEVQYDVLIYLYGGMIKSG
jgi:hypothetical protein